MIVVKLTDRYNMTIPQKIRIPVCQNKTVEYFFQQSKKVYIILAEYFVGKLVLFVKIVLNRKQMKFIDNKEISCLPLRYLRPPSFFPAINPENSQSSHHR